MQHSCSQQTALMQFKMSNDVFHSTTVSSCSGAQQTTAAGAERAVVPFLIYYIRGDSEGAVGVREDDKELFAVCPSFVG